MQAEIVCVELLKRSNEPLGLKLEGEWVCMWEGMGSITVAMHLLSSCVLYQRVDAVFLICMYSTCMCACTYND